MSEANKKKKKNHAVPAVYHYQNDIALTYLQMIGKSISE